MSGKSIARHFVHRNSQKRIHIRGAVYFVTAKTRWNVPYFCIAQFAQQCENQIWMTNRMHPFHLYGYVILPDHVHLLLRPSAKRTISHIMHSIKRNVSRDITILMRSNHTIAGEDNYLRLRGLPFTWQHSYHDHIIRDQRDFNAHIEYIRINPIKHGLVKPGAQYPFLWIGV